MATGNVVTNDGLLILLNRGYKATPDYTPPTRFKIGTGTTTPTVTDTDLVSEVTIDADEWKDFISGYPSFDEANLQVTIRGIVLSTEANSNNLTEFGTFNTDGTPKMASRLVHTSISKTSSIQVTYVEKNKFA